MNEVYIFLQVTPDFNLDQLVGKESFLITESFQNSKARKGLTHRSIYIRPDDGQNLISCADFIVLNPQLRNNSEKVIRLLVELIIRSNQGNAELSVADISALARAKVGISITYIGE